MSDLNDDLVIDPNDEKVNDLRRERFTCRAGAKVFAMVAMTRDVFKTGTPYAEFRMVCVKDLRPAKDGPYPRSDLYQDPENDVKLTSRLRFNGTPGGMRRLGNFAKATGWEKPVKFHPYGEDGKADPNGANDDIFDVVKHAGFFIGKNEVEISDDGKAEFCEITDWKPYKGEVDPTWAALVDAAIDDYERLQVKREENEKKRASYGGGKGGGGKGGKAKADDENFGF